jgi:hypothetical protein
MIYLNLLLCHDFVSSTNDRVLRYMKRPVCANVYSVLQQTLNLCLVLINGMMVPGSEAGWITTTSHSTMSKMHYDLKRLAMNGPT